MKKITKKQGGFTLIEVVLVLAIGALIILMALLAFNGASRARRDTARTNVASNIQAAVEQYAANANGTYPNSAAFTTLKAANASNWKDPKTGAAPGYANTAPAAAGINYGAGYVCNAAGDGVASSATGYVVWITQESGQKACKDNTK